MNYSPERLLILLALILFGLGLAACSASTAGKGEPGVNIRPDRDDDANAGQVVDPTTGSPSPTALQITGNVVDSRTGNPLPTATIYLNNSHEQSFRSSALTTDENGYFRSQNLKLPLIVRVEVPGYELWESTFDASEALASNPSLALEINLTPRMTRGRLNAADTGKPLAGIALTVTTASGQQRVTTDASGTFELYGLLLNDVVVVQAPAGYLPLEVIFAGERDLNLTLQPRRVTIYVHDSVTGKPVDQGIVTFDQVLTTTTAQGIASLSAVPASGQIGVNVSGYFTTTVDYEGSESLEISLVPSSVQGIVRGADNGQPLPQATIYLGDNIFQTDEHGRFVIDTVPITPTPIMIKAAGYHRTHAKLAPTGVITGFNPPFYGAEGRWLKPAACAQSPPPDGPPCLDLTLEPFQARAIYVPLPYLRSRERIIDYLDFIAATELNAIVVDVKGDFGFIAWDSDVDLVSEVGADDWFTDTWMPLDEFIAEARARNIYTVARLVVFKDNPLAYGKPEWATVTADGAVWNDKEELGWANPFREEVWNYNIELAQEVAEFGFDELNFDYIRFPSDGDVGAIVYEEENTVETRTLAIGQFMTQLSEALKPYGAFTSADVFGLTVWVKPDSDMRIGQRIIDVAPQVDYLAPMVYPSTFIPGNLGYDDPSAEPYGIVYRSQKKAESLVPPYVKVRPWLQGYWYSLEEMRLLKQAAIEAESTGWTWWNAAGKYDIELFEPADPAD